MTQTAADLSLAVDSLIAAAIQIGIGAVVLGVCFVLVWAAVRDSL